MHVIFFRIPIVFKSDFEGKAMSLNILVHLYCEDHSLTICFADLEEKMCLFSSLSLNQQMKPIKWPFIFFVWNSRND